MKKRFALLRRKLKSVREEKLPGRAVIFSVAAGLLIAAFFTGMIYTKQELYAQEETQKHLAQEVFRFHVLAKSDSEKDQNLKLQVRDAVLDYMKEELSEEPEEKQCLKQTVQWARTYEFTDTSSHRRAGGLHRRGRSALLRQVPDTERSLFSS